MHLVREKIHGAKSEAEYVLLFWRCIWLNRVNERCNGYCLGGHSETIWLPLSELAGLIGAIVSPMACSGVKLPSVETFGKQGSIISKASSPGAVSSIYTSSEICVAGPRRRPEESWEPAINLPFFPTLSDSWSKLINRGIMRVNKRACLQTRSKNSYWALSNM